MRNVITQCPANMVKSISTAAGSGSCYSSTKEAAAANTCRSCHSDMLTLQLAESRTFGPCQR